MAFITKVSETPFLNRIIRVWMILAEVLSDIEDPEVEVSDEEHTPEVEVANEEYTQSPTNQRCCTNRSNRSEIQSRHPNTN